MFQWMPLNMNYKMIAIYNEAYIDGALKNLTDPLWQPMKIDST